MVLIGKFEEKRILMKGAQDRETRGRQFSRASSKTEALHTTIITIERPRFVSRESGNTVEGSEHSRTNNNTIII